MTVPSTTNLEQRLTIAVENRPSLHLIAGGCTRSASHVEMRRAKRERATFVCRAGRFSLISCRECKTY